MSFTLNGTHISGGTFNNVAGNMNQVLNSHQVAHVAPPVDQRSLETILANGRSVGTIRPTREIPSTRMDPNSLAQNHGSRETPTNSRASLRSSQSAVPTAYPDRCEHSTEEFTPPHTHPFHPEPTIWNNVGGDMTQVTVNSHGGSGMDLLRRNVVQEALHDSGERFPEPACHSGTRTSILEALQTWSIDTTPESTLLWLNGSAGIGKSAIAQKFAGNSQKQGRLGASFFFRRGHPKCGTWNGLFTTIAYQLSISVPELLPQIQLTKLLVEAFANHPAPQALPIVVLDGLDECQDHKVQQQTLRLFIEAIRARRLPVRMLVISRPEPHLREVLETKETSQICRPLVLSADEAAYDDIRTYLRDEFARINAEFSRRGVHLGTVWPSADVLDHLVGKSSGIFIYAVTVIRYIDNEYSHPSIRLQSVVSLDPQSTAPLDDLYQQILSVLPREPQTLRILHAISRSKFKAPTFRSAQDRIFMSPEETDMLLNLLPGSCRLTLRGLNSVFSIPPVPTQLSMRTSILILHASFADYLCDERRSRMWCISMPWLEIDYLHSTIRVLSSPPLTYNARAFYSELVEELPVLLDNTNTTPSEKLFKLLRNQHLQDNIFLAMDPTLQWPQATDSLRAADLYCDPRDTAEEVVFLWIRRAKEVLSGDSDFVLSRNLLTTALRQCRATLRLLQELGSLHLGRLCDELAADLGSHCYLHDILLNHQYLSDVVSWLQKFPDPPLQVIAFWDAQIEEAEQCTAHIHANILLEPDVNPLYMADLSILSKAPRSDSDEY
ncbi:hypothetical protein DFH09DRAFT_1077614 [Mycena vulgaris]|nr:hypothetical protein DFH09DRAFT_1077614 [Mycena vulgaris]